MAVPNVTRTAQQRPRRLARPPPSGAETARGTEVSRETELARGSEVSRERETARGTEVSQETKSPGLGGVTAVCLPVYCSLSSVPGAAAWFQSRHFEEDGKPSLPVGGSVHRYMPEQGLEEFCQLLVENQLHPVMHIGVPSGVITKEASKKSWRKYPGCQEGPFKESNTLLLLLTSCHVCAWNPGPFCMPLIPSAKRNFIGSSLEASRVLRGARVLARRETDGYYYLGHIVQELKGSREGFLVEFDQSGALKGKVQRGWQETPLYDIVHYEDARRQPLAPGDRVLAPWEAPAKRFGPGTVLRVVENTEAPLAHNERGVLVNFWNGQTKEVSSAQALRIPLPLSERITLELQMPLAARQMVVDSSLDYPYLVAPGYRASGHYRQGHLGLDCCPEALYSTHPCAKCSWGCTSLPQGCLGAWEHTQPAECKVQQENIFIPTASLTEEKLSKKIEQELSELRIASSESVSREEEKKEQKRLETENVTEDVGSCLEEDHEVIETEKGPQREMARALVDAAVNTDSWLMETDHKEEAESRQQDAETEANFEHEHGPFETRVAEAPVLHSQRSPSMGSSALVPFRCQSFFAQVNQSLEKDSLTIRSAFCGQRPHSTTHLLPGRSTHLPKLLKDKSITKPILSGASQKRWKELDFSRAKIEHRRWQEEQRQLKREQQQEADGTRRQLRRDSLRQRLRQRTLQGLEKQLEHKERALQHMALLQAAGAERSRKESFFQEEEERKARQRLQFLKTRRLQREELQAESNKRSSEQEKERLELLRSRMQSRQEVLEQESQEQDKQQNQHQAAKVRVFQRRESSHLKMEREGQKLHALQQYLREQKLLLLRASLLE